jgi:hypothetical protein
MLGEENLASKFTLILWNSPTVWQGEIKLLLHLNSLEGPHLLVKEN